MSSFSYTESFGEENEPKGAQLVIYITGDKERLRKTSGEAMQLINCLAREFFQDPGQRVRPG